METWAPLVVEPDERPAIERVGSCLRLALVEETTREVPDRTELVADQHGLVHSIVRTETGLLLDGIPTAGPNHVDQVLALGDAFALVGTWYVAPEQVSVPGVAVPGATLALGDDVGEGNPLRGRVVGEALELTWREESARRQRQRFGFDLTPVGEPEDLLFPIEIDSHGKPPKVNGFPLDPGSQIEAMGTDTVLISRGSEEAGRQIGLYTATGEPLWVEALPERGRVLEAQVDDEGVVYTVRTGHDLTLHGRTRSGEVRDVTEPPTPARRIEPMETRPWRDGTGVRHDEDRSGVPVRFGPLGRADLVGRAGGDLFAAVTIPGRPRQGSPRAAQPVRRTEPQGDARRTESGTPGDQQRDSSNAGATGSGQRRKVPEPTLPSDGAPPRANGRSARAGLPAPPPTGGSR